MVAEGSVQSADNIGSQSYNYAVPILHLPGRNGLDLNLGLHYNSRVWAADPGSGQMTFNVDRDWPATASA